MSHPFPAEPNRNSIILSKENNGKFEIRYGASLWGRLEWVGKIYPVGTRENQYLSHYADHFTAIELNATHFKTYSAVQIQKWVDKVVGRNFIFCPKMTQTISHYSSFKDIDDKTNDFLKGIYAFGKHLGPLLFQVSDRLSPKRKNPLFAYLTSLPKDLQIFLEVRNPEWFEKETYEDLLSSCTKDNIGLVISDHHVRLLLLDLTVPKCFIRYYPTGDTERLKRWYDKLQEWQSAGLKEAYFFVQGSEEPLLAIDDLLYFKNLVENG